MQDNKYTNEQVEKYVEPLLNQAEYAWVRTAYNCSGMDGYKGNPIVAAILLWKKRHGELAQRYVELKKERDHYQQRYFEAIESAEKLLCRK